MTTHDADRPLAARDRPCRSLTARLGPWLCLALLVSSADAVATQAGDGVELMVRPGPADAARAESGGAVRMAIPTAADQPADDDGGGEREPQGTLVRASTTTSIYFAYGSAQLSESAMEQIEHHAGRLLKDRRLVVTLYGYTDDFASSSYSIALGERRARSIRDQLLARGVLATQIRITSYGQEQVSSLSCLTEICRAGYRRVEFHYGH